MAYTVETRDFLSGRWICGPDEYLKTAEPIENIPGAKWIWPCTYSRVYLRRDFELESIENTVIQFKCDNIFDLFINGKPVSLNRKSCACNVTSFLQVGKNRISIRAFQTNDDRFFTSAFTGKIEGESFCIVTDESWIPFRIATFWENDEPEDWQDFEIPVHNPSHLMTCPIHPRLYKRSLYMRRAFFVSKPLESAILHVSAQGEAET